MVGVLVAGNSQRVLDMFLVISHLILALVSLSRSAFSLQISECAIQTHGFDHAYNHEWVFTAPPRFVPVPPRDPQIQAEMDRLFIFNNQTKLGIANIALPPGLTESDLAFIAQVCPKDAFFYSLSPLHVQAQDMLQKYMAALPTVRDVLQVAQIILHNHEINPKIWYYAFLGAIMERPDFAPYTVTSILDAIPDLFIPAPIISEALSRYRSVYGIGSEYGYGNRIDDFHPDHLPLGAASAISEQRIKFDRMLELSNSSNSNAKSKSRTSIPSSSSDESNPWSEEGTSEEKFEMRRKTIIKRRFKPKKPKSSSASSTTTTTSSPSTSTTEATKSSPSPSNKSKKEDHSGAESIAVYSRYAPNNLSKNVSYSSASTTSSVRSKMTESNSTTKAPTSIDDDFDFNTLKLAFGDDDDEYDELRRIHMSGNDTTKEITQRILQRRQRRKKEKEKENTEHHREKRQLFGSPQVSAPFAQQSGVGIRECTKMNGTFGATVLPENALWYFREDIMVNMHHWYWHQMHPPNATRFSDRRAELFFFTHRNLVARYNAERLGNGQPRTIELLLRPGSYIEDGYNPYLIDMNSRRFWTPREGHRPIVDILHTEDPDFARNIFLKQMQDLYYKLVYSIRDGALVGPNRQPIPLQNFQGIDHLANTVESTMLSLNPLYYDSIGFHNLGHQLLGLIQDPQFLAQLPTGVMADTSVAMRDPVFYTFHAMIDNIFDRHKRTLPPYQLYGGDFPLVWPGVAISGIEILPRLNDGHANRIRTFWSVDRVPLESGIDNSIHNGQIREEICAQHLNHEPFSYKITVNVNPCVQSATSQGMIRVFLAPRYDEYGHRFPLKVQRRLMIQLDVFPAQLRPGRNVILRRAEDSSLTQPWPTPLSQRAFQQGGGVGAGGAAGGGAGPNGGGANWCGCGWPRHLLIPKGNQHGMHFDLFVIVTNFDEDVVQDTPEDLQIPEPCTSPYLMCGIPFRRYPDARPMGYPFDRLPYKVPVSCGVATGLPNFVCKIMKPQWFRSVGSLEEFVQPAPNMGSTVVEVLHVDTLIV